MNHTISDNLLPQVNPNVIPITDHLLYGIRQTDLRHWESLFQGFRFNLQNRIVGSDDRELLKLQAKIEEINELEQFFKVLLGK